MYLISFASIYLVIIYFELPLITSGIVYVSILPHATKMLTIKHIYNNFFIMIFLFEK